MNYNELEKNTEYIIKKDYSSSLYNIIIIEKHKNVCLLGTINPNSNECYKEWVEYNNNNFTKVVDKLEKRNRSNKLNYLMDSLK
jgi:predicted methyltransferase